MCIYIFQIAKCGCQYSGDFVKKACENYGTKPCEPTNETRLVHTICESCTKILRRANTGFEKIEFDVRRVREMIADECLQDRSSANNNGFEILQQFDSCIESLKAMLAMANREVAALRGEADQEETDQEETDVEE
jgi:hypothetical protein